MTSELFAWKRLPKKPRGVLCGAEKSQEWLLPWWWSRYSEHNDFPVTFYDFGMTDEMKQWCAERGELVTIEVGSSFVTPRSAIDDQLARRWEEVYGWRVWHARQSWFKKPFAFLDSPYENGIWIDLDCEILGSLEPLFKQFDPSSELALIRDRLISSESSVHYDGGVVVFKHGSSILQNWARSAGSENHLFGGDDTLLSHLIHTNQLDVQELPEVYNWRMPRGLNLSAVILHWVGNVGKAYIRTHGGLKPSLDSFFNTFKGNV